MIPLRDSLHILKDTMEKRTEDITHEQSALFTEEDVKPSGHERFSTQKTNDFRDDLATSSKDFFIKLEPPWSIKEEPQDHPTVQPSAVGSTAQPVPDITPASLLSLNPRHVCQRCSATFVLFSSWELHMVTFHGDSIHDLFAMYSAFKCSGVGYHSGSSKIDNGALFNNRSFAKRTEKVMDEDADRTKQKQKPRNHVCDVCSKAFTKPSNLAIHKMIHAGLKTFVCDVCDKAFTQSSTLKQHMRTHTGHKPFECEVCGKAFTRAYYLKAHKLIHTGDKAFVCDLCGKSFTLASDLKKHELIHSGSKPFVCDVCSKAFTRAGNLKAHKLIHTGHKPFVCDVCSKVFSRSTTLKQHKMIHTHYKPFMCDVCNKTFSQPTDLEQHKLSHTGSYTCEVCEKTFCRPGSLKLHMLIHSGQKPHVCEICNKAFTQSSTLKQHMIVHTRLKPHKCDVCGEAFAWYNALRRHKGMHTEDRVYECPRCDTWSNNSDDITKHIQVTHASDEHMSDVYALSSLWTK